MTEVAPEHESVEAFVEFCMDDEVDTFTHEDLGHIAFSTRQSRCVVRGELESYGLTMETRAFVKRIRTFSDNPHDRWYGPGSEKMHGGSGWEQISGFAGQKG